MVPVAVSYTHLDVYKRQIRHNGQVVTKPGADRVMMFQEHALFPWLSVKENVKFGMSLAGLSKPEQEEYAMHYLKMVELDAYADYPIHKISGGMKQRASLARALAVSYTHLDVYKRQIQKGFIKNRLDNLPEYRPDMKNL